MKLSDAIAQIGAVTTMDAEAARPIIETIHAASGEAVHRAVLELLGEKIDERIAERDARAAMEQARRGS
jgi:hypothetical protein